MWDGVADGLAEAGHPVVAVDLRGHGTSPKPEVGDDAYDVATVAADVTAATATWVAAAQDHPTPVVLVGQSYGGTVVFEVARQLAEAGISVAAIVGVDGGFFDLATRFDGWAECEAAMAPPRLLGTPASAIEAHMRTAHPDWPEAGISAALACYEVRDDATIAPWLSYDRHIAVLHGMWKVDCAAMWAAARVPVLLLVATDDTEFSELKRAEAARAHLAIPTATLVEVAGDHDLHAQHPLVVARHILSVAGG